MHMNMSISVNGQSQVPPGFRFHPTEDELLQYYLRKKVSYEKIDFNVLRDVDLNKLEPWDIQEMCKIGTTPQNDCYFFSHKDRKYPTGTRTNRATAAGFWKATGRDKAINSNCSRIGTRKTLVFYRGRAPHGQKSDWIIHEYRLDDNISTDHSSYIMTKLNDQVSNVMGEVTHEEGWVVCRIFKQNNHIKTLDRPANEPRRSYFYDSCNEGSLDQIVQQMGRTCKEENESNIQHRRTSLRQIDTGMNKGYCHDRFFKLPSTDGPNSTSSQTCFQPIVQYLTQKNIVLNGKNDQVISGIRSTAADPTNLANQLDSSSFRAGLITNWAALDRLVASHQLNRCQTEQPSRQLSCFGETTIADDHDHFQLPTLRSSSSLSTTPSSQTGNFVNPTMDFDDEIDLWSYAPTSSGCYMMKMDA